ncbi:MAG: hypothetical protein EOO77_28785 [Oxalobacteraceae bacterium]|nr:MAG: hypothetical protein EOO77_28785 [Oxalobacteraceae bacterium]
MALPEVALDVESILALDPIDDPLSLEWPKRYIARELGWIPTFDRDRTDPHGLYGGQVIAQTVWAACHTVAEGFDVHSTHGYFLRPGNSQERIVYNVFEVRTGRGYATRRIEAIQFDKVIYTSFANFKRNFSEQKDGEDNTIQHGMPYPSDDWFPRYKDIPKLPVNPDVDLPALSSFKSWWKMPVRYRKFPMDRINRGKTEIHTRRQVHFLQSRYEIQNRSHNFQAVYLMYASDRNFLFTATNAHLASSELAYQHVASLDHSFILHRAVGLPCQAVLNPSDKMIQGRRTKDSDEWVTYDTHSPAAGNARCLTTGYMWDSSGRHLATVMQEAVSDVTVIGPAEAVDEIDKQQDAKHGTGRGILKAGSRLMQKYKL